MGLAFLAACGSDATAPGTGGPAISVAVVPATASLLTGGSQDFTATVTNDPANRGVIWSITGCAGGSAACGRLTSATATTATYAAPAAVPPAPVGVTATSVADADKSFTATVVTRTLGARQIAFFSLRDGGYQIDLTDAEGSGVVELTPVYNPVWAYSAEPVWSPDGSKIAFYDTDIYVMNFDGSGSRNLTNSAAWERQLAWSPDGTKILFESMHCQINGNLLSCDNPEIHVMNADGSNQVNLTNNSNNPAFLASPAWSPDGTKILFVSDRDGNREIYVMNADGSGAINLTNNPAADDCPTWSPDGTRISFERGNVIYVMHSDGSSPVALATLEGGDPYWNEPAWSPDGTKIAFRGVGGLSVINADGSDLRSLTSGAVRPKWSPDGTKIAFTSDPMGSGEIYVINVDGSGLVNLTNNPAWDGFPAWRPR